MTSLIRTTTVGSYPVPAWLESRPSESAVIDATRVIFSIQRQAGIDLPTDGEIYRFNVNHPDTNGMIDYFVDPMSGTRARLGRSECEEFAKLDPMRFRASPAAVVEAPVGEGSLNLLADCLRAGDVAMGPFKFTVTSPYMLARTLLDRHYRKFDDLLLAIADVLAEQVRGLPCHTVQVDEANIPGNPADGPLAAEAINRVLDAVDLGTEKAVHFCFGNYGGQVIQTGTWNALIDFLNRLHTDHLILELAHRPDDDLQALCDVRSEIGLGIGVIDIKVNHVESESEVARRIEQAASVLGEKRITFVHPDCGFWMLKRSICDRKLLALSGGRDLFLNRKPS